MKKPLLHLMRFSQKLDKRKLRKALNADEKLHLCNNNVQSIVDTTRESLRGREISVTAQKRKNHQLIDRLTKAAGIHSSWLLAVITNVDNCRERQPERKTRGRILQW